jgi:hypothetical protein
VKFGCIYFNDLQERRRTNYARRCTVSGTLVCLRAPYSRCHGTLGMPQSVTAPSARKNPSETAGFQRHLPEWAAAAAGTPNSIGHRASGDDESRLNQI